MVRLKLQGRVNKTRPFLLSQFHYGSIKTTIFYEAKCKIKKSQFHYGSIKTVGMNGLKTIAHLSLNSTMVRLKLVLWLSYKAVYK